MIRTIVEKSRGTKEDSSSEQISLQGEVEDPLRLADWRPGC